MVVRFKTQTPGRLDRWTGDVATSRLLSPPMARRRGGRPGTDNLTPEGRATRASAVEAELWPTFPGWVEAKVGHREMARRLNADGLRTRTGKPGSGVQVGRVIRRMG